MKRIVVHIDGLVLRGVGVADPAALRDGLRAELGRLLAEPAVLAAWTGRGSVARVRERPVAPVVLGAGTPSHTAGVRLARAVAGGAGR